MSWPVRIAALSKGVPVPPAGYGFLRVGSPGASQSVRVGSGSAAPRILIPRPPAGYAYLRIGSPGAWQSVRVGFNSTAPLILIPTGS